VSDHELLGRYAAGSGAAQEAFAELVKRHLDFVYSVAVRQVRDRHLAEDVTQAVFLVLAKKAGRINERTILSNWLFCTTRYTSANALKREARRRHHEHKNQAMTPANPTAGQTNPDDTDAAFDWESVAPLLDNALDALGRRDREAVLLKYIEGRSHRDVGHVLGISEEAARKRINRAIERLRGAFVAGGVTLSVAAVAVVLSNHAAGAAAPAGLAGAITAGVGAGSGGAAAASLSKATMSALSWAKAKIAIGLVALGATGAATGAAVKWHWFGGNPPVIQAQVPANPAPKPQAPVAPAAAVDAKQIEGVIRTPDETPAIGAEVFIVAKEDAETRKARLEWQAAMMTNRGARGMPQRKAADSVTVYAKQWPAGTVSTDGQGHFSFPAPPAGQPWILVARHPSGFAQIPHDQFAALKGQIDLQSWGQVEGRVLVGTKPQPNIKVMLYRSGTQDEWEAMQIRYNLETFTDVDGRFSFKDVAPGDWWLSRTEMPQRPKIERHVLVDVKPGVVASADIGGKGRPVKGRGATTPENDPTVKIDWSARRGRTVEGTYSRRDRPNMALAPGWERQSREEQLRRMREWERTTPEGRLSLERQWGEPFEIFADGSFYIPDLVPGKYSIQLRILETENHFGIDRVMSFVDFDIPPLPEGKEQIDEPLDLGTIAVKTKPQLVVGKPAPDFTVKTLDGKTIKLSDFRGKMVVLKWWWNWSPMETEGPAINRAYQSIKNDPNAVLITIAFDQEVETTKKRVADWKLGGIHAWGGGGADYKTVPENYFGSPSTMCIIGPDGNVRAKNLVTEDAETEIAKVLLER
jgi:RNA polymerase sigma factor (sigma-70 family)